MVQSTRLFQLLRLALIAFSAILLLGLASGITYGQIEPRPEALTAATLPGAGVAGRHVSVSDWVIQPTQTLSIAVQGYAPYETLTVLLYAPEAGEKVRLGEAVADAQGQAQLDVTIPAAWPYGIMENARRQVLRVESQDGARDLAELSLVDGPAVTQVPAVVEDTLRAVRAGDAPGVRTHLTGAALELAEGTDLGLEALTGLRYRADEITGMGARLTRLSSAGAEAEVVLMLGYNYVRLTVDLRLVSGEYKIEAFHHQGLYR